MRERIQHISLEGYSLFKFLGMGFLSNVKYYQQDR